MEIYLFLLLCLLLLTLLEVFHIGLKHKSVYFWAISILLILVSGLRYGLESDYWHYYRIFNGITRVSSLEVGFQVFNAFIRIFTSDFGIYCLIVAVISMGMKCNYFKKYKYPFVILFCYYLRFYVLFELNAIRQGISLAFLVGAIYYLTKNNLKKYLMLLGIAVLFHSSAICGLFALVVKGIRFKLWQIVLVYIGCLIFRFYLFDYVIASFSPYIKIVLGSDNNLIRGFQYIINSGDKMQEIDYLSFIRVIIPGICLYFISNDKNSRVFYNLYFIGSIINILFWGLDTIAFRIPAVFYIFEGYIINNALMRCKLFGSKKRDLIFTVCLLSIFICDIWTFTSYLKDSETLIPYRSILSL